MPVAGFQPDSSSSNAGDESLWSAEPLGGGDSNPNANQASSFNPLMSSCQPEAESWKQNYEFVPEFQYLSPSTLTGSFWSSAPAASNV